MTRLRSSSSPPRRRAPSRRRVEEDPDLRLRRGGVSARAAISSVSEASCCHGSLSSCGEDWAPPRARAGLGDGDLLRGGHAGGRVRRVRPCRLRRGGGRRLGTVGRRRRPRAEVGTCQLLRWPDDGAARRQGRVGNRRAAAFAHGQAECGGAQLRHLRVGRRRDRRLRERGQRLGHFLRRLRPVRRVLGHHLVDDGDQLVGHVGPDAADRLGLPRLVPDQLLGHRALGERRAAGQAEVERGARGCRCRPGCRRRGCRAPAPGRGSRPCPGRSRRTSW